MKSLKNHFSVIFSLFVILFSLEFVFGLSQSIESYEEKMNEDYSLVIVSKRNLETSDFNKVPYFKTYEQLSTKKILQRVKNDISAKNISLLQLSLPKFYSVKLAKFLDESNMNKVIKELKQIQGVSKVESFEKTYDKIYKMLNISKSMSIIFTFLLGVMAVSLIFKQMRIWVLEHKERMDIMSLFGAPFWMQSAVLYRLAIIDSFIASFLVIIIFAYIPQNENIILMADEIGLIMPKVNIIKDVGILIISSLLFSLLSVSLVMRKVRKELV